MRSQPTAGDTPLNEHDEAALKDYLGSFDVFKEAEQEGRNYITHALRRFMITVDMTPPALNPDSEALELGANPYFITLMLMKLRGYRMSLANYFGEGVFTEAQGTQHVSSAKYNESYDFTFDYFNAETEAFPYPDGKFDLVLYCEILEHLVSDPTRVLCEIHRILKPGGSLLLTTPNVLNWHNLQSIATGRNIYDLYSGYGIYGRHNREYTPAEVTSLMDDCGFKTTELRLDDLHPYTGYTRVLKRLRPQWRDNIFVLAQAVGHPRHRYPDWLYRSRHGVHQVVNSEIIMGENDDFHLGAGWHGLEPLPSLQGMARWSTPDARAFLLREKDESYFGVEFDAMATTLGEATLSVQIGESVWSRSLTTSGWQSVKIPLPDGLSGGEVEVQLRTNPVRIPAEHRLGPDHRELGIRVKRMWLE
jgi:SAM-dependent methyltransferase